MKLFHTRIEYGIKALTFLARAKYDEVINANIIAKELCIPKEYTSKILQELTKSGIVFSKKGKGGGFILAKHPDQIMLREILDSLGVCTANKKCLFGFEEGDQCANCFVCEHWELFINKLNDSLNSYTLNYILLKH